MKTKNLLFLILLLGLSFNTFSQEEVTIKQVIKNSSTNAESFGDAIKVIKIWAKIPVTIKSGKENAIYLTGDMKENEKDKLSSFCVLKNNVFEISSPYLFLDEESKPKDFSKFRITLELADDVYTYYFRGNGNVTISKDIITEGAGTFNIWDNSQIIIEGEAKFGLLNIFAQENSKIRFNSINANGAILNMEKGSIIDLNGKVKEIEVMNQGEGAKIIGDYNSTSLMYHNLAIQDDDYFSKSFVGRPKHKRDPLKIDKDEDSKFIKDTFSYSSLYEAIKLIEGDTITKAEALEEAEYNRLSNSVSHEENVIIGKNARVNITFVDKDKIGTDYVSNYPIKGYENGQLVVQDDYPLDLELTIRNDIGNITLKNGAEVNVLSKINEKQRSYFLFEGAKLNFNNETKIEDLSLQMQNRSKLSFKDLKSDKVFLQGDGTSDLELNGEIKFLDKYKYDDINLKGDYKIDSIKERKIKMFTITTPIPFNSSKSKEDNILNDKVESEKIKAQKQDKDKLNFSLQLGYGILGWSNRVSSIDNLFASPKGQYTLSYSDSWSLGFRYVYKLNKRWVISTGLGYESNIFRFENNVMLTDINGDKRIDFDLSPIETESKLVARYVTLPLFVKFKVYKSFNVHVGAIAGVNFRTSSTGFKRDYEIPNAEVEERWGTKYDDFKPLKLDVQAGFGWNSVNFYAKYSLIPLFKDNKEIEVYPFSVGVSFGL
ncbi:MAG: outer membrane beta-barrel protein [Bacteroidales bacterium]|nr:outer membrane beta-barrel protein [Bacteroidales bacterium]